MTRRALFVLAAAMLLGSCSGQIPSTGPTPVAPLPPGVSRDQVAPLPGQAKDARGVPPCEMLTTDQARRLGIDPTSADPLPAGVIPGCRWQSADLGLGIGVSVDTTKGLANLYGGHAQTPYKIFEPLSVDGYPAVRAEQIRDGPDCTIYVGLAENQAMWVIGTYRSRQDSCPITRRVITEMLANLPPLR